MSKKMTWTRKELIAEIRRVLRVKMQTGQLPEQNRRK